MPPLVIHCDVFDDSVLASIPDGTDELFVHTDSMSKKMQQRLLAGRRGLPRYIRVTTPQHAPTLHLDYNSLYRKEFVLTPLSDALSDETIATFLRARVYLETSVELRIRYDIPSAINRVANAVLRKSPHVDLTIHGATCRRFTGALSFGEGCKSMGSLNLLGVPIRHLPTPYQFLNNFQYLQKLVFHSVAFKDNVRKSLDDAMWSLQGLRAIKFHFCSNELWTKTLKIASTLTSLRKVTFSHCGFFDGDDYRSIGRAFASFARGTAIHVRLSTETGTMQALAPFLTKLCVPMQFSLTSYDGPMDIFSPVRDVILSDSHLTELDAHALVQSPVMIDLVRMLMEVRARADLDVLGTFYFPFPDNHLIRSAIRNALEHTWTGRARRLHFARYAHGAQGERVEILDNLRDNDCFTMKCTSMDDVRNAARYTNEPIGVIVNRVDWDDSIISYLPPTITFLRVHSCNWTLCSQ